MAAAGLVDGAHTLSYAKFMVMLIVHEQKTAGVSIDGVGVVAYVQESRKKREALFKLLYVVRKGKMPFGNMGRETIKIDSGKVFQPHKQVYMRSATSLKFDTIEKSCDILLFGVAVIGQDVLCESGRGGADVLCVDLLQRMHYVHGLRKRIFTGTCVAGESMVGEVVVIGKFPLIRCKGDEQSWKAVLGNNV